MENTERKTKKAKVRQPGGRRKPALSGLGLVVLTMLLIFTALASLTGTNSSPLAAQAATNVLWSPPVRVLDYSGRDVALAQNPIDQSVSYAAASSGYGIVVGQETNNWLNGDHIKLATDTGEGDQYPRSAYDEFATLYVVWGARNATTGKFNIWFNRVLRGAINVTIPRNLTAEMFGLNGPGSNEGSLPVTGAPHIAYSVQQHKIFVAFIRNVGEGDNLDRRAYFSESGDQGTTWSKPIELGQMSGYAPAIPNIIVDKAGLPHFYYGVMAANDSRSWIYERVRGANGQWSEPRDIVGAPRTREFEPRFTLAPNGDIWSSWFSDPATGLAAGKELTVAHWNSSTDQWQSFNRVGGEEGVGNNTIAVGDNGQVWVMWTVMLGEPDAWRTDFTYSTDNGQSWQSPMLVVFNAGWYMKRSFGMSAVASKGLIYFMLAAETNDPDHATGDALFLQQIPQDSRPSPNDPTPTPLITPPTPTLRPTTGPTPTVTTTPPSLTPSPGPNVPPASTIPASPGATATAQPTQTAPNSPTSTPTATATATATSATTLPPTTTPRPAIANTPPGFEVAPTVGPTLPAQPQPTTIPTGSGLPSQGQPANITPIATPTLPTGVVSATAYAQAQASAAAQSVLIPLPTVMGGQPPRNLSSSAAANNNGSGGNSGGGFGPLLDPPTPTPTATPRPTPTPAPTATPGPTITPVVSVGPPTTITSEEAATITAQAQAIAGQGQVDGSGSGSQGDSTGSNNFNNKSKKAPPEPGPVWLAVPGFALVGKGLMNLLGPLFKSIFKKA